MKHATIFALCLAPELAVFVGMISHEEILLQQGMQVELSVKPRDPMSLMRGRYLAVELAVATVDLNVVPWAPDLEAGRDETIYLKLRRGARAWEAAEVTRDKPPASDAPFLRGTIYSIDSSGGKRTLSADFGMDEYFIPQEANDPSFWSRGQDSQPVLSILARVDENGRALIEDLLVNGQPFAEWNHSQ